jgi:hypothetical protein
VRLDEVAAGDPAAANRLRLGHGRFKREGIDVHRR